MCAAASRNNAKKPDQSVEKRRAKRHACRLRTSYALLSPKQTPTLVQGVAHTRDVSESGVSILVDQEILTPTLMQLSFAIPSRPFRLLILARAVQSRWNEEVHLHEIGLKFVGILSPAFKNFIAQQTAAGHASD